MSRMSHLSRGVVLLTAVGTVAVIASCTNDNLVFGPSAPPGGSMFDSYVALGNSITAGFQSGGINDSTQRVSYAALLARQVGTRYAYASFNMPGCPAPIANFVTGARQAPPANTVPAGAPCYLRSIAPSAQSTVGTTDILNNVAVPNAASGDPTSTSTTFSTALTTFILGGKTQVQRALEAKPTFATIWIGSNDALGAAFSGFPGNATAQATFTANYDKMISELLAGAPSLRGVLIGIPQVVNTPLMFNASALARASFVDSLRLRSTKPAITIDPTNCPGSTSLINFQIVDSIKTNAHPPLISCAKGTVLAPGTVVGDAFVLEASEQAQIKGIIDAYNAYISAKAAAIGFAYYDPNKQLDSVRALGQVPVSPATGSTTNAYGQWFSLDGFHPSTLAHKLIANSLIAAINAKYGTSVPKIQ